jgi:hypothetical protein
VKVIIAGGRDFNDYDLLCRKADKILSRQDEIEIVSGTAKGADKLGEKYAKERDFSIKRFPADWGTHGKKAGYMRNEDMALYADALIAFWDEQSKGTKHMIDIAELHGLKIRIVRYNVTN